MHYPRKKQAEVEAFKSQAFVKFWRAAQIVMIGPVQFSGGRSVPPTMPVHRNGESGDAAPPRPNCQV